MSKKLTQFTSPGSRVTFFREQKSLSQQEFADYLGFSRGYIGDIETDRSRPSSKFLTSITSKMDVSADWILTGEGDMLIKPPYLEIFNKEPRGEIAYGHSEQAHQARTGLSANISPDYLQDFALIPFYDVEVSAGHGSLVDQELQTGQMAFKKDWLKQMNLQPDKCALIKARGDSMEPTIYDGDLLLVDTRVDSIIDDTIYIVQTENRLIVKRIQQTLDGSLTIISDNKKYREQSISRDQANDVKIAGKVKWYGHEI